MKREVRFLGGILAAIMFVTACQKTQVVDESVSGLKEDEVALVKCAEGNPMAGKSDTGDYIYGGDPSVLVDGDTVYVYTGHDISKDDQVERKVYNIPEYLCYSSKDLKTWKAEGSVMKVNKKTVDWTSSNMSAWASQVAKHYDKKAGKDRYYLYYCTWDATSQGKQSIGVAVADKPTGPFEDIGKPLVQGTTTVSQNSNWDDIDPTVWVETGKDGEEHRYLGWGNSRFFTCELNEDMISVKDLNGDGKITYATSIEKGDILPREVSGFTEAPWFYRRQNEKGEYVGPYYLFYASGWREKMAYSTTDDLMTGTYTWGESIMYLTATSNTNHEAVFDFKGKTYFVYHNGSLPGGNGYRRSACIRELKFGKDGSVEEMEETAIGLTGTTYVIRDGEKQELAHAPFNNSSSDTLYPYKRIKISTLFTTGKEVDKKWVFRSGKADAKNAAYVSIEAENKPGLYITANADGSVTLAQDADASEQTAQSQTFRTVKGLKTSRGTSFESVAYPGKYLVLKDGMLKLGTKEDKEEATFYIDKK